MQKRRLGALEVSMVGLGCATMTPFYDEPDSGDRHGAPRARDRRRFS
jgi:aryl-alcohol dehydrogenase-like predicted oxidoreductase